jgi:hypothetical protein
MEHIAALLLIVGCNNGLDQCRELPAPVAVFETVSECAAQRPKAIASLAHVEPRLFSRCLVVDPALEDDYDQITWNVRADGTFEAAISVTGTVVASNGYPSRQRHAD